MTPRAVLLDTCAVICLAQGAAMSPEALGAIRAAQEAGGVLVSPISAWEVGQLSRGRAGRPALTVLPDPKSWFQRFMAQPGVREAPLTCGAAVDASWLPGNLHRDPGDRHIIATARELGVPLVTRDAALLAYAQAGFVAAIRC